MGREKKNGMGRMNGRKVDELIRAQLAFFLFYFCGFLVDWFDGLFCWFRV